MTDESYEPTGRGADPAGDASIPPHEQPDVVPPSAGETGVHAISLDGFKQVYAIRDFRLLFWGGAISALGDWVGTLAFIVAAQELAPDRPAAVAVVLVLRLLPSFFATPLGGVLSDRSDRKRLMITSDLARFAVILAVPFFPHIGALYAFAFFSECFALMFLPARDASIPNIVGSDRLEPANAMVMGSSFGAIPLAGPMFALLAWLGSIYPSRLWGASVFHGRSYAFPLVFDAVTFLVSAEMIRRISLRQTPRTKPREKERLFAAIEDGARYILNRPFLRGLSYAVTVAMLGGGVLFALGIGYVRETLGGGTIAFGFLMGLFGVGMTLGFLVSQIKAPGGAMWMVRIAMLVMGAVLISMAIVPWLLIAYLMAVVFGLSFSVSLIIAMSTVQGRTDDEFRGRVMGAVHMLVRAALSFGALGAGALATLLPDEGLRVLGYRADHNQIALVIAGALIAGATAGVRGREPA